MVERWPYWLLPSSATGVPERQIPVRLPESKASADQIANGDRSLASTLED